MQRLVNVTGSYTTLNKNWTAGVLTPERTLYFRPSILAVFTILQTMLITGFTADCLLMSVQIHSKYERMAQKLIHSIYLVDVIILSIFATEIVLSLTQTSNENIRFSCSRTDLQFLTKVITIVWISVGIAFARLTLVEILAYCGVHHAKPTPEKMYIFTKALIYYTFFSVILFAVPVMIQSLPTAVLCVPMPNREYDYTLIYVLIIIVIYGVIARKNVLTYSPGSQLQVNQEQTQALFNNITRVFPFLSITFLTLFPFILLNFRTGQKIFNIYKVFGFYVALSLSNITINRIYNSWSQKQIKKYQYFVI